MTTTTIIENHRNEIDGVLTCLDRIVIGGTLEGTGYPAGMTMFFNGEGKKIFDYNRFANGLREDLRKHVEDLAKDAGTPIDYRRKWMTGKLDEATRICERKGNPTGLICIFGASERCSCFKPKHFKENNVCRLIWDGSQCVHYYLYFNDPDLGLCSMRVPTWAPFKLQFCCNGHSVLSKQLEKEAISCHMLKNSFDHIDDYRKAQQLADNFPTRLLEDKLNYYADVCCPVYKEVSAGYYWTVKQMECATDVVFKEEAPLQAIYPDLLKSIMATVQLENVATFLGRRLTRAFNEEAGTRYNVLFEGKRVKHTLGKNSIKIYDKFSRILRIETTTLDVSTFTVFRRVNHKDGTSEMKNAKAPKRISFISRVAEKMQEANNRYLNYVSAFGENQVGRKKLTKVTAKVVQNNRSYKGFNFFDEDDAKALEVIIRGEINIGGFRNKDLRKRLKDKTTAQVSRLIKRMRLHGILRKAAHGYKYYLTDTAREVVITILKIKEMVIIPSLA